MMKNSMGTMYIKEDKMSSFTPIQLNSKIYMKLIGILSFCKLRMSSKVWDYIPYIMDIYVYIHRLQVLQYTQNFIFTYYVQPYVQEQ